MSASSVGLPPQIEHQLMILDKQLRDAAFIRGVGRLVFGTGAILGASLYLDNVFDLSGPIRGALLVNWIVLSTLLLWQCLIRPLREPTSFPELAALIERRHPELRERLTSLVELRGYEEGDFAPGTSKLMQELLARQTIKVFDRLEVDQVLTTDGKYRPLVAGLVAMMLLFVPFFVQPEGYGLLWNRFFVPWGNLAWGTAFELKVAEGNQTIARGADATVHVSIVSRRGRKPSDQTGDLNLLLNWSDEKGLSDSQRLVWDPELEQYATTLTHVMRSLTFQVTAKGAKSCSYRVDVSDPPSIKRTHLQIEPAAYTGLPARSLEGVPGEVKVAEFSRIELTVEFTAPVASAELSWPTIDRESTATVGKAEQLQAATKIVPIVLSNERRAGQVELLASGSGPFVVRAKNEHGLENDDPIRMLLVIPDQPPQILLQGDDQPLLVRPDEQVEIDVAVTDDFGLTAVELHAESSSEIKHVERLTAEQLRDSKLRHHFKLDLSQFELKGGQVVTYRIRAVDNRPQPNPHEIWSAPRLLLTNTSLKQLPNRELADAEKSVEDELTKLRTEVLQAKSELSDLHRKTEDESLGKEGETDKNAKLEQMRKEQEQLVEQLEQLTHRLAERGVTEKLADQARQIADQDLKKAEEKVEQSKDQPARNQLEPLAQAIDHLGNADRQLGQLEQRLNELNKLEQDLAELSRMAQNAERVADQLEKLDPKQQAAAPEKNAETKNGMKPESGNGDEPARQSNVDKQNAEQPQAQSKGAGDPPQQPGDNQKPAEDSAASRQLEQLKEDSEKLNNQLSELMKKHPELLDAARNAQIEQMNQLAQQARDLGEQQSRLGQTLKKSAENPAPPAAGPENNQAKPQGNEPAGDSKSDASAPKSAPEASPQNAEKQPENNANQKGADAVKQQEQLVRAATEQALEMLKETGSDSDVTKAAADFARKADAAQQQAQAGDLKAAAQQAAQAAQSADETAKNLNPDGKSETPQSDQAKQLADQQRKLAEQLKSLSDSKDAVQGAQLQGQNKLSSAANRLQEQFQKAAESLKSAPLDSPNEAASGEKAAQATQQAQQAMNESKQANRQNNPAQAAQSANEAVEKLQQAADLVKPLTPKSSALPVSDKIATPVTEAMKRMETAQQQLSQCNCSKPGGSGQNATPQAGQTGSKIASNDAADKQPSQSPSPDSAPKPSDATASKSNSESGQAANSESRSEGGISSPSKDGKESPAMVSGKESGSSAGSNQSEQANSEFAQAANQFRSVAALLRQARGQLNENPSSGQMENAQASGTQESDSAGDPSQSTEAGDARNRTAMAPDIRQLEAQLSQQNQQNWGRLPGQLRTEILQGAGKKSHVEYRQRIKAYFEEISKPAK